MRGILRERRQISAHRQLFFKKLDDLLDFSHFTPIGRQYVREDFEQDYEVGIDKQDPQRGSESRWVLDENSLESGGIFDPHRAKELEVIGINMLHADLLDAIRYRGKDQEVVKKPFTKETNPKMVNRRSYRLRGDIQNMSVFLTSWREDYKRKYNEEPRIIE